MNPLDPSGMLGAVLQHYPDGVLVIESSHQQILLVNQAVLKLFDAAGIKLQVGSRFPFAVDPGSTNEITLTRNNDPSPMVLGLTATSISHGEQQLIIVAIRDITDSVKLKEQLKSEALNEDLTNLYNRKGFVSLAEHALILAQRELTWVTLVFLDLDGLKTINDYFGHAEGDYAIKAFADILKQSFRKSDILARLGGDEFAVLVVSNQPSAAESALQRVSHQIAQFNERSNKHYSLSSSWGIASFSHLAPQTLSELMETADANMYQNKRAKKVSALSNQTSNYIEKFPKAS